MVVNKFFLLISLVFALNLSYSQVSIGLNGAITQNKLLTNTESEPQLVYKSGSGYSIGLEMQYQFCKYLSIVIRPSFMQKNYKVENNSDAAGKLTQEINNSYIQLPIAGRFTEHFKELSVSIEGGGFIGYWIKSYEKGTVKGIYFYFPNNNIAPDQGSIPFRSDRDRRIESGWLVGGEIGYQFSKEAVIHFNYDFFQSLTDQQKNYMLEHVERFNRTQTWGIGVTYSIKNSNYKKSK